MVYYCVQKNPELFLSQAKLIQSTTSHPVPLRSILILSSQLYLDFSSGLLLLQYAYHN
jgi:hypothetical protein